MIRSMTGFCKSEVVYNEIVCEIEMRSVNNRFLDARIHLPKQFQFLDEKLKKHLKEKISRGKVDVTLKLDHSGDTSSESLTVNQPVWENTRNLMKRLEEDSGRTIDFNFSDMLKIKDLLIFEKDEQDEEEYEKLFSLAIEKGIDELLLMKNREGELLYRELTHHVDILENLINQVPEFREEIVENYKKKLQKNLQSLDAQFDQNDPRIMQEIGIFLDRSDITEEIERFSAHLIQIKELLISNVPVGRKLDFLLQELNREANTLCSKSNHTSISQIGVELKCEIEKIREQIQNIE